MQGQVSVPPFPFPSEKRGPHSLRPPYPCTQTRGSGLALRPQDYPLTPRGSRERMPRSGSAGPQLRSVEKERRALWSEGGTPGGTEGLHTPERQPCVTPDSPQFGCRSSGQPLGSCKGWGAPSLRPRTQDTRRRGDFGLRGWQLVSRGRMSGFGKIQDEGHLPRQTGD